MLAARRPAPRLRPVRTLLLAAALPLSLLPLHAQNASTAALSGSAVASNGSAETILPDADKSRMLHHMALERNELRQKAIADDTTELLQLAEQLKSAVDKSDKDQLSLNVVRTASEIERLAKVVKDKMRDGH